jgi:hypothetical protein
MSRQASMPLPSGKRTSMRTTSGFNRRAPSMASAMVPTSATICTPRCRPNIVIKPRRTTLWSSTISNRIRSGFDLVIPHRPTIDRKASVVHLRSEISSFLIQAKLYSPNVEAGVWFRSIPETIAEKRLILKIRRCHTRSDLSPQYFPWNGRTCAGR